MNRKEVIQLFGLKNLSIEAEIRRIERETGVDFGHQKAKEQDIEQTYYPQFDERLRAEAERMSANYIIFYCLENDIRTLIVERLTEEHGTDWWEKIPEPIRKTAKQNRDREKKQGFTPRSDNWIDFTNFGDLSVIITDNWGIFGDMFRDQSAVTRILSTLNTLRAPIAHCKALAEDEESRLHIGLRDWFRQME